MQLIGDPQYVKQVKKANKKGYTYLPELYKDKFDGQAGGAKRKNFHVRYNTSCFNRVEKNELNSFCISHPIVAGWLTISF